MCHRSCCQTVLLYCPIKVPRFRLQYCRDVLSALVRTCTYTLYAPSCTWIHAPAWDCGSRGTSSIPPFARDVTRVKYVARERSRTRRVVCSRPTPWISSQYSRVNGNVTRMDNVAIRTIAFTVCWILSVFDGYEPFMAFDSMLFSFSPVLLQHCWHFLFYF